MKKYGNKLPYVTLVLDIGQTELGTICERTKKKKMLHWNLLNGMADGHSTAIVIRVDEGEEMLMHFYVNEWKPLCL